jgi:hypothetical protein
MFDLETAKKRLGITGSDQDIQVQMALDASLMIAQRYCDRLFTYGADVVYFYYHGGDTLFLPRFPVEAIISARGIPQYLKIHSRMGMIQFAGYFTSEEIEIRYTGGYQVLPPDLEMALWGVFDSVWPSISGTSDPTAGAIDSITIPDVGTIRMNNSSGSASSANNANVLGPFSSILDNYRRVTC